MTPNPEPKTDMKLFFRPSKPSRSRTTKPRFIPRFETLDSRLVPTVTAAFDSVGHLLLIAGDDAADDVAISRTAAGDILVNGSATGATLTNCDTIQVNAGGSDDAITIDQTIGAFAGGFTAEGSGTGEIEFQLSGGAGDHDMLILLGTTGPDTIHLGNNNGVPTINLNGDDDADVIAPGLEEFRVRGQDGSDILDASGSAAVGVPFGWGVELDGGTGNDVSKGGAFVTTHVGGAGNDTMTGGSSLDKFFFSGGGLGSDTIFDTPNQNNTLVFGGFGDRPDFAGPVSLDITLTTTQAVSPGNLSLKLVGNGIDVVIGSPFADTIKGNARANEILGLAGNDNIDGRGGSDLIDAGIGNDTVIGGEGNDSLKGGEGNDTIQGDGPVVARGGTFDDHIDGGTGNDNLQGQGGDDLVFGEEGNDTLTGSTGNDFLTGGDGSDSVLGGAGDDEMYGEAKFRLGAGNPGNDTMRGGTGDDTVQGQGGNDKVWGDDG